MHKQRATYVCGSLNFWIYNIIFPLFFLSEGDYVIKINDFNVQEANLTALKEIFPDSDSTVRLTLRRAHRVRREEREIILSGVHSLDDLGVRLGVVAMTNGNRSLSDLRNYDEIIQV